MTYLMRLSDQRPDRAIDAAIKATIAEAMALFAPAKFEGPWTKGGLGIVNLRARDIAQTNQSTGLQGGVAGSAIMAVTAVTVSTWTNWLNLQTDDRAFQIITGVFNRSATPHITHIQPFVNGQDQSIISIEEMYTWDMQRAWFIKPYIITPGNLHKVQVLTDTTIAGVPAERIGLMGYTLGRRTYLIAQS